jgi:predicted transposase/invertase (TIGR01784 family)
MKGMNKATNGAALDPKEAKRGLNRLNDRLFKYIFAERQRKENLIRFLNDVLNDPKRLVVDVEYLDRELNAQASGGKAPRFDVRAKTADRRVFHVEVQIGREDDFLARCLCYTCMEYSAQIRKGEPYAALGEVVFIAVMNFELFDDRPDVFHSTHKLLDVETHKCHCDGIEMHFLELPKLEKREKALKNTPEKLTNLERMLVYMGTKGDSDMLYQIAQYDSDIARILRQEDVFLLDPDMLVSYVEREREQTDWNNYVKSQVARGRAEGEARGRAKGIAEGEARGEARGRAKGIAEGEARGKAETAANMLRLGMDKDIILRVTGLSPEELANLKATL